MNTHKKASAMDIFGVMTVLFALAVGVLIMSFVSGTITSKMRTSAAINSTPSAMDALDHVDEATAKYDLFGVAMFIGLFLGIIITGYLVGGYAIFAFIYFVVIVIGVIISAILANTWETISTVSTFAGTLTTMPMTNHIILYLPFYIVICGFVGMIAMFAKPQQ